MKKFEVEVLPMGVNNSGYPGAFTPIVNDIIKTLIGGKVLHLYSGSSLIGMVRVDITHPNATINQDVEEFIATDTSYWDWVILDPPYAIKEKDKKLAGYGIKDSLSGNTILRNKLRLYFREHTENVLWLDQFAPVMMGFQREKLWFLLPSSWETVRVLSWLKRTGPEFFTLRGGITNGVGGSLKDGQPLKV